VDAIARQLSRQSEVEPGLAADGLFVDSGLFHVMPDVCLVPLEELFRARVITFLVKKGLLPPERARMLRGWTHSGFNIHRSQRVPPRSREDMERLAQYIIRNPFSVDKMQPNSSDDSIIYRSRMNPKIQRNFEVFSPCDFIARITQHIPDKSFQLVRYYGWYSNKMRGQRLKRADAEAGAAPEGEVIDVSAFKPRRIPSKSRPKGDSLSAGQERSEAQWQLARTHQESLGSRPAPVPSLPERAERSETA